MRQFSKYIICAMLPLMAGCRETAPTPATGSYKTLRVEKQDYASEHQFMVRIESQQRVDIQPVVGGTLKKICVSECALVKKGQPLFIIDQAPYIAAVNAAKAQVATARVMLSTAQLNLEGKEQLYAQQMVGEYVLHVLI